MTTKFQSIFWNLSMKVENVVIKENKKTSYWVHQNGIRKIGIDFILSFRYINLQNWFYLAHVQNQKILRATLNI